MSSNRPDNHVLLDIRGMIKRYRNPGVAGLMSDGVLAVDGVDLQVRAGESVGLIGESGSGKTTLVRAALGLLGYEAGEVSLLGRSLNTLTGRELRSMRGRCQLVLQSPDASLNPGSTVRDHLLESARLHKAGQPPAELVREVASRVGIGHRLDGLPYQLSGGEKRRVGIARLLLADPVLTVADEPTAGLDAALKAEIIDLLLATRSPERGHLFISHDIPLITYACERVAVMYAGRVVEELPVSAIGRVPHHPYTTTLLHAAGIDVEASPTASEPATGPSGAGCPYTACSMREPRCSQHRTELRALTASSDPTHRVACHVIAPGAPL
jgi:peptide/nickel transport system ATP-binding protein